MMVLDQSAREVLRSVAEPWLVGDEVFMPTTTLLPGGELATVVIRADEGGLFSVSDNGSGREAALNQGVFTLGIGARRKATKIAESSGLHVDGDAFVLRRVSSTRLVSAISFVADASRIWAEYIVMSASSAQTANISDVVQEKLERVYTPGRVRRQVQVLGASTTQYEFDFSVEIDGGGMALFEIVGPSIQSIAFAHTKFSDVARAHQRWPREAVVEDLSAWTSDQTSLLSQVTSHIRSANEAWDNLPKAA